MTKKNENVLAVVATENTKRVSGKVSANVEQVENTALALDAEELETPKKQRVFTDVRALFGFLSEDTNEIGDTIAEKNPSLKFSQVRKAVSEELKRRKQENAKIDNIAFSGVCEKIQNSPIFNDFKLFVGGCDDLLNLSSLLLADNGKKVVLFHGSQSDDGEKFETMTISKKGLHKPYKDLVYFSTADYSTQNVIRAFRCYCYYLQSMRRVNKQIANEQRKFNAFIELAKELHDIFGYMPEDFVEHLKF